MRRQAYLNNGERPTVIRIRRDDEAAGKFVCIIQDDGLSVSRKRFHKIGELAVILESDADDDPTYRKALAAIVERFTAVRPAGESVRLLPELWGRITPLTYSEATAMTTTPGSVSRKFAIEFVFSEKWSLEVLYENAKKRDDDMVKFLTPSNDNFVEIGEETQLKAINRRNVTFVRIL